MVFELNLNPNFYLMLSKNKIDKAFVCMFVCERERELAEIKFEYFS